MTLWTIAIVDCSMLDYSMREEMPIKFQPYYLGYLEIFAKRNLTSFYLSPKLALSS